MGGPRPTCFFFIIDKISLFFTIIFCERELKGRITNTIYLFIIYHKNSNKEEILNKEVLIQKKHISTINNNNQQ